MNDSEFLFQFENCTLPKEYFTHLGHLRIAWIYLTSHPLDEATIAITNNIKRYASSLNAAHIYHETLTRVWIYLVYNALQNSKSECFDNFIANNKPLLNAKLPLNYYSEKLLFSDTARQEWVPPDLKPL